MTAVGSGRHKDEMQKITEFLQKGQGKSGRGGRQAGWGVDHPTQQRQPLIALPSSWDPHRVRIFSLETTSGRFNGAAEQ